MLATPATAAAHLRSGTVAVDFRATIFHPQTAAYTAKIFQSDRALSVTVKPGHTVELIGYLGEPVFRLDNAGLAINRSSPTAAALRLIGESDHVDAPTPRWQLEAGQHSVVWHDARTQTLPPGVRAGEWRVPLLVDGSRVTLRGDLRRYPAPLLWPWIAALLAILAAGLAPVLLAHRASAESVAIGAALLAAAATIVLLAAFAFDAYASPGTWIEAVDSLVLLAVGVWVLRRGPQRFHVAAAIGMGLVALAVGLLEGAVFFHPIVLAVLPATVIRVAAIVAIGAGIDAFTLGIVSYSASGWSTLVADPGARPRV
jgi:hypothetical protein